MQSDYINYSYSKYRITFEHTCKYRHQSHAECGCCYQGAATAMWGMLNLVILLCIYSTSCSWQWEQKRRSLFCKFSALCIYFLSTLQGSQPEHQFVPVTITGRWGATYSSSQIRGLENVRAVMVNQVCWIQHWMPKESSSERSKMLYHGVF